MYAIGKASRLLGNRIRNFKVMIPIEEHPKYDLIKVFIENCNEGK